jgi:hypothetical protein
VDAHLIQCCTYDGALDRLPWIERKFCCCHSITYARYIIAIICEWGILFLIPWIAVAKSRALSKSALCCALDFPSIVIIQPSARCGSYFYILGTIVFTPVYRCTQFMLGWEWCIHRSEDFLSVKKYETCALSHIEITSYDMKKVEE